MKIIIKLIFLAFLVLCCDTKLSAQEDYDTDSAEVNVGDLTTETIRDTVLNRNQLDTLPSIQEYKKDRDFAYMKYLDSLLRQTEDLRVDTFSVGNATSTRGDKGRQNSRPNLPRSNIFSQPVVKIILWILAAFLIGFIIYKIFLSDNFFRRNRAYKNISDTQKDGEDLSNPSAYDNLISKAVRDKNYRLAIRYSYLQTLQKLSASGMLQFAAEKTNYQYVSELHGKPYQNDFAALTLNYEYVWYGKFDISEDAYNRLSKEYKSFHQKV